MRKFPIDRWQLFFRIVHILVHVLSLASGRSRPALELWLAQRLAVNCAGSRPTALPPCRHIRPSMGGRSALILGPRKCRGYRTAMKVYGAERTLKNILLHYIDRSSRFSVFRLDLCFINGSVKKDFILCRFW